MGENNLPPGFRFHPTDEELISCYLTRKVSDSSFTSRAIVDVDINKCEPWDLPGKASMGEKEWYFFNLREKKYPSGLRTNRATEAGYWKTTGKDREILQGGTLVGMKKTLVFYKGRAPKGQKTNWVMHEYRLENKLSFKTTTKDQWVVCRVFKKSLCMKKPHDESPYNCDTNPITNDYENIDLFPNNLNSPSSIPLQNRNFENGLDMNLNWHLQNNAIPNLSMNANLLLKALQLRNISDYSNYMLQGVSQFGNDFSSNLSASSSSRVLDYVPHQQPQEKPFDLDSIW